MGYPWHLFGNDGRRYRTLDHSPNLDAKFIGALERFSWGQARNAEYLNTLDRSLALWVHPIASGQHAFTRILKGEKDGSGRWSQAFLTLVVPSEVWAHSISVAMEKFCNDKTQWPVSDGVRVSQPTTPSTKGGASLGLELPQIVGLVREALSGASPVVAEPESLTLADCEKLFGLLSARERGECGFAFRAVSDALGVTLSVLDPHFVTRPAPLGRTVLRRDGGVERVQPRQVAFATASNPPSTGVEAARTMIPALSRLELSVADSIINPPLGGTLTMTRSVAAAFIALFVLTLFSGLMTYKLGKAKGASATTDSPDVQRMVKDMKATQQDVVGRVNAAVASTYKMGMTDLTAELQALSKSIAQLEERLAELDSGLEGTNAIALGISAKHDALKLDVDNTLKLSREQLDGVSASLAALTKSVEAQQEEGKELVEQWAQHIGDFDKVRKDFLSNSAIGARINKIDELIQDFIKQTNVKPTKVKESFK